MSFQETLSVIYSFTIIQFITSRLTTGTDPTTETANIAAYDSSSTAVVFFINENVNENLH